jgi:hypothetical protein
MSSHWFGPQLDYLQEKPSAHVIAGYAKFAHSLTGIPHPVCLYFYWQWFFFKLVFHFRRKYNFVTLPFQLHRVLGFTLANVS